MIVDSSALVSILLREEGHEILLGHLNGDGYVGVAAPTLVEAGMVMVARIGPTGKSLLDRLLREASVGVESFTYLHWTVAVDAYMRFGKGRHKAALNFGDCIAYAAASVAKQPLVCVGNDFAQTDIELVIH